jgi:xylitol oxidase
VIHGAKHIDEKRIHPVIGRDALPCVTVGKGSWREKLYHFRPDAPPSSAGEEIQSEFYVAYKDFRRVMEELYKYRHAFKHLVQVTESRMLAADNIPLSPAKGQAVIGIHFTWVRKHDEIMAVLPLIEQVLSQFNAKPHYGKLFIMSGRKLHSVLGDDFQKVDKLIRNCDPQGKFSNKFIKRYLTDYFDALGQQSKGHHARL